MFILFFNVRKIDEEIKIWSNFYYFTNKNSSFALKFTRTAICSVLKSRIGGQKREKRYDKNYLD